MAYLTDQQQKNLNEGRSLFDNGTLTSNKLLPTTPLDLSNTAQQPIYPVKDLNTDVMELTQPEQEASSLSSRIQALNDQYLGKSAYTAQQEQNYGMNDLIKTQNDLSARLKAIQNEAQAIPLQLQNEATGRGITAGGLAPIQTARLRANAIQALSTSSLLEASKGNLATAQTLVDRAVAQKYDPIKEEIDTLTKNLQLIKDSPEYSLADKNRANAQLAIQEARKQALAKQEAEETAIMNLATEAAKNGADALTLDKISKAQTQAEALQYASPYMQTAFRQQQFENNLSLTKLDIDKQALQEKINQQAFENNVTLENLKLDKAKFASDEEYRNAQLMLDQMKLSQVNTEAPQIKDINGITKQWNAQNQKWEDVATEPIDTSKSINQINLVKNSIANAEKLAHKSGSNTWWEKTKQGIFGATEYTNLVAETNTLRTNILTMMTDPAIKKFFGPQMSNADVQLMTSAGTTLNPELQSPEKMKQELTRLKDLVKRAEKAVNGGKEPATTKDGKTKYDLRLEFPQATDAEIDALFKEEGGFSMVGGDTNKAVSIKDGSKEGQCGRFVNKYTGLGLGDSYKSKLSKMDSNIKTPEPGMVFVMPYKNTGHAGFIQSVNNDGTVTVKDSNWGLDGKVKTHKIPVSKITGLRRV